MAADGRNLPAWECGEVGTCERGVAALFGPGGAGACSHGWSVVRRKADEAQPVEAGSFSLLPRRGSGSPHAPSVQRVARGDFGRDPTLAMLGGEHDVQEKLGACAGRAESFAPPGRKKK